MCFCLLTFDSSSYEVVVKVAKELGSDEFGIAPYPIYDMGGETERIVPVHMEGYSISCGGPCIRKRQLLISAWKHWYVRTSCQSIRPWDIWKKC